MLLSEKYADAIGYAAAAHAGQTRKGTSIPYISHPLAVSALAIEHGGTETQAIAALLHDVLEDCGGHHAPAIGMRFGPDVLHIVRGLTDGVPDGRGKKPEWRQRKEAYLEHLLEADMETVLVSACDKVHNAIAIADDYRMSGDEVFGRFTQPREGTVWYYRELGRVLSQRLGANHRLMVKFSAAADSWGM